MITNPGDGIVEEHTAGWRLPLFWAGSAALLLGLILRLFLVYVFGSGLFLVLCTDLLWSGFQSVASPPHPWRWLWNGLGGLYAWSGAVGFFYLLWATWWAGQTVG